MKGPDVRLHLPHSLVLDLKGVNMSCKSHAGKKPTSVEAAKEKASRKLYGAACDAERFEVPCFHVCGRMNPAFIKVVRELVGQREETLNFKKELVKCSVAIQRGVGRTLLAVSGARKYVDGKAVFPPAKAKATVTIAALGKATRDVSSGAKPTLSGGTNAGTSGAGTN